MSAKISYKNKGRSGSVIYQSENVELEFYYELGGGDCVAIISIPLEKDWEKKTQTSKKLRHSILDLMARQVLKDKVPDGTYQITSDAIEFYRKKHLGF